MLIHLPGVNELYLFVLLLRLPEYVTIKEDRGMPGRSQEKNKRLWSYPIASDCLKWYFHNNSYE